MSMNLESYEPTCVAGTLKKYLRELPNPVIPEKFYTKFIDAASKFYQRLTINSIIVQLLIFSGIRVMKNAMELLI